MNSLWGLTMNHRSLVKDLAKVRRKGCVQAS